MQLDYKVYYWNIPFRGNFIEMLLEDAGAKYQKCNASEIYPKHSLEIDYPGMASPYLYDCNAKKYYAQTTAIMMHLAKKHGYLPEGDDGSTLAIKILCDCEDILIEITKLYGMQLWDEESWQVFRGKRLARWMKIFEKTGLLHGMSAEQGFMLGDNISVADIATAALFGTMIYCLPGLADDLNNNAPNILGLCQRIELRPKIQAFLQKQRAEYGDLYCDGKIERSLREMMG